MKYDIFLSHCKENKSSTAVPLYQALNALGFRVWFDRGEILTGDMIYESIETALYDSSMIVALVATEYLQRTWTQYELHLAIELEQDHAHRQGKRVFPIYQKLDHKDVELIFPQLKDRAFESLSTDYFDVSTKEGHSILDRIVLFYFSHCVGCTSTKSWTWLFPHRNNAYISQLCILLRDCEHIEKDLRTCLISYTNAIRYVLAILSESNASSSSIPCHCLIANRYCTEICNRCFSFYYEITHEMLLSCKAILWALNGDLKTILDAL